MHKANRSFPVAVFRFMAATLLTAFFGIAFPGSLSDTASLAASLPGGASSLQESYQDWRITCTTVEQGAECLMVQEQRDSRSGQRVLAVKLERTEEGTLSGALLMPFGLAVAAGVTPQVDDGEPGAPLPFSTCLPAGCIVPMPLDAESVGALRRGASLRLTAQLPEGDPILFAVSL